MSIASSVAGAISRSKIDNLLRDAGIVANGSNPWDPQIKNDQFYQAVVSDGMLGLGDSYVQGCWDCDDLEGFFYRACSAGLLEVLASAGPMQKMLSRFQRENRQARGSVARTNVTGHYDRGNDLFQAMFDPTGTCHPATMAYTCALWDNPMSFGIDDPETLEQAQIRKIRRVCRKLGLEPGMTVLDLGCGWSPFGATAVKEFGVRVTGLTLSEQQVAFIKERYGDLQGLEVIEDDWRNATGEFDRVVAIGLHEHVGLKNLRESMEVMDRCLKLDGLAFTHCFGRSDLSVPLIDTWTEARIFFGAEFPTVATLAAAADGIFDILDLHEIGLHYTKTLIHWCRNFEANWGSIDHYGEEFRRMWRYYMLSAAGAFRARKMLLWQMVYAKKGSELLYMPVR